MSAVSPGYDHVAELRFGSWKYTRAFARSVPVGAWIAALCLLLFIVAAIAPGLFETHDPYQENLTATLKAPSFSHLFGTDQLGRDLFSRVVAGTRQSLVIGFVATALAVLAAIVLGLIAGLGPKWADGLISRLLEVMFAFPVLLLALLVVAVFGDSITTEIAAVALGTAAGYARMLRGQVISVRGTGYVESARVVGHSSGKIVRQHILPNAIRPLVALYTLGVGQAVIWASGLSFLGLGVPPPSPEWGALLDSGRDYVTAAWWLEVMPGLAIVILALSVTVIGRHLQARLEGRIRVETS
jgi:peptide/nickel transport system permease protein